MSQLDKMSEWQVGYVAGFFDGEGSICISKGKSRPNSKPHYVFFVELTNTNREVLEMIRFITGLGRIFHYPRKADPGRKPIYRYRLHDRFNIYQWLSKMRPYLIVKRERAELAIDFCKHKIAGDDASFETYYLKMRELNK